MDIYFRNNYDSRVGFIIGTDIKDNSGSRIGYIEGDYIKANSGSRVGYIEGSSIKDNYGTRVGYIEGNIIKDNNGNRVGYPESSASSIEMCAAALLLFGLEEGTSYERKRPESAGGWLWYIITWLFYPFYENIKYFKYSITRKEWWGNIGRLFLLGMFLTLITSGSKKGNVGPIIVNSIMFIPMILASLRRMRDLEKPWWWVLVPIYSIILCGFVKGKD